MRTYLDIDGELVIEFSSSVGRVRWRASLFRKLLGGSVIDAWCAEEARQLRKEGAPLFRWNECYPQDAVERMHDFYASEPVHDEPKDYDLDERC